MDREVFGKKGGLPTWRTTHFDHPNPSLGVRLVYVCDIGSYTSARACSEEPAMIQGPLLGCQLQITGGYDSANLHYDLKRRRSQR